MEDFPDVARARASFKGFIEALATGREIMRRAGVADPPPIPEFDAVFRRLTPEMRQDLYATLRENSATAPAEALRIWQPLLRRAFGPAKQ